MQDLEQATVVFRTARLCARRLRPGDAPAMHAVYGDADAMRWVGDGGVLSLAQCERWIALTQGNYAKRGYGLFALAGRAGGVVGFCGLVHPGDQSDAEIKYALAREHWGRGYATEAAKALLDAAAERFGLERVIATTAPENTASHRVLLKAGMVRGALRREDDGSLTQLFCWSAAMRPAPPAA